MLEFTRAAQILLKKHPDFSEKWLKEQIVSDPTILGLGDVEVVTVEKLQPKAGRLDILLYDEQLNRRYEVELMLGPTDPSHIIRCIEYWDIERRRYPAYDHVAVLVAEDITSRFLNVMGILAGSVPLIAVQFVALQVNEKIALHCVHVLDQTALRIDDTFETGGPTGPETTDRAYWENRVPPEIVNQCDNVRNLVHELTNEPCSLRYRKRIIDVTISDEKDAQLWLVPKKTLVRVGGYVADPESWVKRFDDAGQTASLRRGNKAVLVSFKIQEFVAQSKLLRTFLQEVFGREGPPAE